MQLAIAKHLAFSVFRYAPHRGRSTEPKSLHAIGRSPIIQNSRRALRIDSPDCAAPACAARQALVPHPWGSLARLGHGASPEIQKAAIQKMRLLFILFRGRRFLSVRLFGAC
jgi:hypothetical protein